MLCHISMIHDGINGRKKGEYTERKKTKQNTWHLTS